MPPDAPLDFAPAALQPLIRHDGVTDRRRFEAFFLPAAEWERVREAFWARTGFPGDPDAAVQQLKARLIGCVRPVPGGCRRQPAGRVRRVAAEDGRGRAALTPAQSDSLAQLHRWLDARSRSIRLADLLIEVENDLGLSVHFQQPGEKRVDPGEVCALLAALEFYSFVADNYAPFLTAARSSAPTATRPFVLDGVLYHESDLAAFGMVGMRFCPRIRSLHRKRIYCADPGRDHGVLEPVVKRGRRAVNFRLQASNRLYAANRERGRGAEDRVRAGTCPSRNCGRRCGVACSRSSSSTP